MQKPNDQNVRPKRKPDFLVIILVILFAVMIFFFVRQQLRPKVYPLATYGDLESHVSAGHVENLVIKPYSSNVLNGYVVTGSFDAEYEVEEKFGKGSLFKIVITEKQLEQLDVAVYKFNTDPVNKENQIVYNGITPKSGVTFFGVLLNLLPILILVGLGYFLIKNAAGANNQAFDFAKSRARVVKKKTVTFEDVAGAEEEKQELSEVIDFLKNPKKYKDMGARIPKGVLLVGPPGTGKTLIAKAVAGEASVPFFTISGSDFVEMFVGVGASRVRDLFKVATQNSPCIIFIDEIDAVGRQRGAGLGGGHDEREQTLNQLLVEMDGFNPNLGIIVIAATNRPDVLDPALLRPGRFDRQITIDLPDVKARAAILKVHARNKKIGKDIDLEGVAHRTPGFSGADIENLLNEAALLAARHNRVEITLADIDEGIDRVMMGPAKKSRKYSERERNIVAVHEAGHAVIGLKLHDANIVQKVTIIPRGRAGGYNLMVPREETFFDTKESLLAKITGYLGGRVAEEIVFESVTNGAHNDFEMATKIARAMVTEFGMSSLGPIQYEQQSGNVFLGRDYLKEKNFSDQVALEIDQEVRKIVEECHENAKKIITENRKLLDNIAKYLILVETLTKADIDEIMETGGLKAYDERAKQKAEELKAREQVLTDLEVSSASLDQENKSDETSKKDVSENKKVKKVSLKKTTKKESE